MLGILGTGGHSKVISDILISKDNDVKIIYFSLKPSETTQKNFKINNYTILVDNKRLLLDYRDSLTGWHIAIGNNHIRKKKYEFLKSNSFNIINVIHEKSIISNFSEISIGTSVMAGAVINIDTKVGVCSIINTTASVDHDCRIGDFVNIGPGCKLSGNVNIGNLSNLGTGTIVIPNISIGENCIIGAGSVVINDIPDNSVAVGIPARIKRTV